MTERSGQEIWRERKEAYYSAGVDQLDERGDEVINARHSSDINNKRVEGDNPPRHKCWMCKTFAHWPNQCPTFAALSIEDRIKCAKANQVCFSFLKRAGREHRMNNCSRSRRCTKMENGIQCPHNHHHQLYRGSSVQISVAMAANSAEAVLPVLSANIGNANGIFKRGNAHLDSGSQISLIKQETTETLGLKGASVTITKVGGEEETLKLKQCTVQLTSIDDNKRFTVEASGIPSISNEITTVNTSHLSELLGLPDAKIHRRKEHVDLLIGIDHVHMHIGDTRQVEHLLVRNSPLVWVVFGGNPTAISYVTRILHMRFATPLDLSDFWTSEAMGVMVKPCVCDADKLSKTERKERRVIEDSCIKIGNQWMIPYPWNKNPNLLPDNKPLAVERLESLENRLKKNPG